MLVTYSFRERQPDESETLESPANVSQGFLLL